MKVLLAERVILNVLSFDLIIEQPFNAMIFISTELSSNRIAIKLIHSIRSTSSICMEIC